ncbi:MAG: hypothetical protein AAF688_00575 [Bacteroidota bacterium]
MKKFIYSFFALTLLTLSACEGPIGPPGPPGFDGTDGLDGGIIASSAFEIVIDFNEANNYEFVEPYGFEVFPSDVTLVYISWEVDNGQDVWRLLPQNVFFDDNSVLTYNYDFTQNDVRFFLDGTTNLNTLGPEWTDEQVFRVVVVPADNIDGLDITNFNLVTESLDIDNFQIK